MRRSTDHTNTWQFLASKSVTIEVKEWVPTVIVCAPGFICS